MEAALGIVAEESLAAVPGQASNIDAFEQGTLLTPRHNAKKLALVLLSPIWIPLFMLVSMLMVVPAWIYFPYRTYRDWDDAKRLGVSQGMMIFGIVMLFLFGIAGGIVLTLVLVGRFFPLFDHVLVARTGNQIVLFHRVVPGVNIAEFRRVEFFPHALVALDSPAAKRKIVLRLRPSDGTTYRIAVNRLPSWSPAYGNPEVRDANLSILLGQHNE